MIIRVPINRLRQALEAHGGGDGVNARDLVAVDVGGAVIDGIRETARWTIHRFEPGVYERLTRERQRVADALAEGHRVLREGRADRAGDVFSGAFDMRDRLVNRRAYDVSVVERNALLNEGINALTTLICGGAETAYNNANAQLGVGSGTAPALTGTLTFTQWSASVTGAGTSFTTGLAAGDWVKATTSAVWYRVKTITSNTALTLEKAFEEATETGVAGYRLAVSSTDLPAGTNTWVGMDTGYPTFGSGQNMVFQSVFNGSTGNHAWNVFGVRNGAAADKNMNMKFDGQSTKTAGQTWTLNLTISLA